MDLSRIPLFEAITKRMAWLSERQSVLAQNVANVDTPGYLAKDVKAPDFATLVAHASQRLPLAATAPGHIAPVHAGSSFKQIAEKTGEKSPNGNNVQIEDQMMKVSDTTNDFALTTSLYRAQMGLLKLALGRGTGSG